MEIAFVNRSRFLEACEKAIRVGRIRLENGEPIEVTFDEGGYSGRVAVAIPEGDSGSFTSDWEGSDPHGLPGPNQGGSHGPIQLRVSWSL